MKRLTALLIALVLLIMPVAAETGSYFDYTDDILEDGSLIYYFQEVSLELPASWKGKVMAEQVDAGVCFYQKSSHEKYLAEGIKNGGFLFRIGASVNHSFSQLPKFEYLGFSEESAMNYYLQLPTDYPAYNEKEIRAEYDEMLSQIDYVVEHVKFYSDNKKEKIPAGETDAGYSSQKKESSAEAPAKDTSADELDTGTSGRDDLNTSEGKPDSEKAAGEEPEWTTQDVRYFFEHSMLPKYFYDRPDSLLNGIRTSGLYVLWEAVCKENSVKPVYPEEEYITHWYTAGNDIDLVQIELPAPDANTLCYRIYLVYDAANEKGTYYTVESNEFLSSTSFLCTWSKDGEHEVLDSEDILDPKSSDYQDALLKEAEKVASLAEISETLTAVELSENTNEKASEPAGTGSTEKKEETAPDKNLQEIACPQQGFTTMADKTYPWNYEVGTGITIYTEHEDSIPYVIVYQGEDLLAEPLEYIREQFTPYMEKQYGDALISHEEKDAYEIGGKTLPAGIYTYKVQNHTVEMIRIYDSTGKQTVAFTAKYLKDQGDATLKALDNAVRYFKAE